jgi:stage II sporulation protein M
MIVYAMKEATGFGFVILSILPHGVVELPTVILSAAIGVKLGQVVFLSLLGRKPNIIEEFFNGMRTFFCFILPLLLLAALIEVYITPHLL